MIENSDLKSFFPPKTLELQFVDAHFLNPCPKAHTEESPMKSKAQRPTKKTEEQERIKERSARERDLQQNTVLW